MGSFFCCREGGVSLAVVLKVQYDIRWYSIQCSPKSETYGEERENREGGQTRGIVIKEKKKRSLHWTINK